MKMVGADGEVDVDKDNCGGSDGGGGDGGETRDGAGNDGYRSNHGW